MGCTLKITHALLTYLTTVHSIIYYNSNRTFITHTLKYVMRSSNKKKEQQGWKPGFEKKRLVKSRRENIINLKILIFSLLLYQS